MQTTIGLEQLKKLPSIIINQIFTGNQTFQYSGLNYEELDIRATYNLYNLIYKAIFMVEQGIGYTLSLDKLVNTASRHITFVPIEP